VIGGVDGVLDDVLRREHLLVGVIFGTCPALRASRLWPVDAIQRE